MRLMTWNVRKQYSPPIVDAIEALTPDIAVITECRWTDDGRDGAGTLTVRLHSNDTDRARKLNRTENLRPIPATDPDFARLYPRRNDAKSINRDLDDTLYLRRAHNVGHARQHLNLLGYDLIVNSVAFHRFHRQRLPDRLAA